ncbi:MAG: aminoacyl-tRNA deacylase [Pyrobaculum sp.]|nr:aminoacyl-tRNA deacylase [Pyrobaculum sp.]
MGLEDVGEVVKLEVPVRTVREAARAVGVGEDKIIKTIVVNCGGEFRAYILRGTKRLDVKSLGCRLATPEEVLSVTGYPVGGVPPVLNIPVFIDEELLNEDYVYGGGGDDHSLLRFKPRVLVEKGLAEPVAL